jgi:hypothetical protein
MHRLESSVSGILHCAAMFTRRTTGTILCLFLLANTVASCSGEPLVGNAWSPGGEAMPPKDILAVLREGNDATLYRVTGKFSDDFEGHEAKPKIANYPKISRAPFP